MRNLIFWQCTRVQRSERGGKEVKRGSCVNKIFFWCRLSNKINSLHRNGWQPTVKTQNYFTIIILTTWSFVGACVRSLIRRLQPARNVSLNKLILTIFSPFPLQHFSLRWMRMCVCVSMWMCAWSVGVNNVHYIVAIPNVLVSRLGVPLRRVSLSQDLFMVQF